MIAELAAPIRAALVAEADITGELAAYKGSYPIFTRRPAPADAPYPMILVSSDITATDVDGIADYRPVQVRDIAVYGKNDTAEHYRQVEDIARAVRELFHRQSDAIAVSGWGVTQITASGPRPAPTDDEQTVGRVVELTVQLYKTY